MHFLMIEKCQPVLHTEIKMKICLNACFCSDHQTLQSIQGQTSHGCLNHDTVVGLYSELLMRLSYYIYLGFGKTFRLMWESTRALPLVSRQLYTQTKALSSCSKYISRGNFLLHRFQQLSAFRKEVRSKVNFSFCLFRKTNMLQQFEQLTAHKKLDSLY